VEIIAVNDGSTDATLMILNQLAKDTYQLRIISHSKNQGYGSALRSGIKRANYEWILLMDSDGQFHFDSLESVWSQRGNYGVLLGYRQKREDSPYRLLMGRIGNSVSNIFLGRSVRDINCGFKLFRKELLQPLSLFCSGGIINFEILYTLFKKNKSLDLYQFSVHHYARELGKSTGGNFKVICRIIIEGMRVVLRRN
jgi:glycosyltransferase involved in cell wall biosynthesis